MLKSVFLLTSLFLTVNIYAQAKVDLDKSVPLWLETDTSTNISTLKWIADENSTSYTISTVTTEPNLSFLETIDGAASQYEIGELVKGQEYAYHVLKSQGGVGIIRFGHELPAVHTRGRCLILIDDILTKPLELEIRQLVEDMHMDGWAVDTSHTNQGDEVVPIKNKIQEWYDANYTNSQALFLLGHVPVPYSGNAAHDGHGNHQGAWAADVFYGELDGLWRDVFVDNTSPTREKNKNVPYDGKYDQTQIPSMVELEVGRVDFHDLPAFPDDEIELTRKYLNKSHDFKIGNNEYPRRAMIENNFGGFAEGFGQSGWRNFTTMFGGDNVSLQNYEVILETDKYLCSYACGGGSYTSCAGVGTTTNLWVAKDIQSIFTLTFGSYFGDWDSQNNFLRSALGSGDILTNAWAGRPVWYFHHMATGKHIGFSTKFTQNASEGFYGTGFSAKSAHIALMGDPTLRLHPLKGVKNLAAEYENGDITLTWDASPDANHGYFIYRQQTGTELALIAEIGLETSFTDRCVPPETYNYMVKAIRLEESGSGTYFNTSLGSTAKEIVLENPALSSYFPDVDMDGFGNPDEELLSCALPPGFVDNGDDCDDMNSDINPNAEEIANNGIDEDCDGADLLVATNEIKALNLRVYPNPAKDYIIIEGDYQGLLNYTLYSIHGKVVDSGNTSGKINLESIASGFYYLKTYHRHGQNSSVLSFVKKN